MTKHLAPPRMAGSDAIFWYAEDAFPRQRPGALEIGIDTDRECRPAPERISALLEAEIEAYAALSARRAAGGTKARGARRGSHR